MKVLVADDDRLYRTLLQQSVSKWGYDVIAAADGQEAWDLLHQQPGPRVAILDWQMPALDGVEICRRIKGTADLPFIYTIMLTGRDSRDDMVMGLEAGADDFLSKPVDTKILRSRLEVATRIVAAIPPQEWALPRVPGYEVKRLLGKGTAGSVWEAKRTGAANDAGSAAQTVALKIIRRDLVAADALTRFAREIEFAKRLEHEAIARVFDSRIDDQYCFYAMELIDGCDLAKYAARTHPAPRQVLKLMLKVCAGMAHAHHEGVVHRDLKPQNILVTGLGQPKIVDFGLAKSTRRAVAGDDGLETLQDTAVGTPMFMAPEQARGDNDLVDARTDVYALGVILYLLLLRHHPHKLDRSSKWELMRSIADGQVRPPSAFQPDIDPLLEKIIMKALCREPDGRYPNAAYLGHDLKRFLLERMPKE